MRDAAEVEPRHEVGGAHFRAERSQAAPPREQADDALRRDARLAQGAQTTSGTWQNAGTGSSSASSSWIWQCAASTRSAPRTTSVTPAAASSTAHASR